MYTLNNGKAGNDISQNGRRIICLPVYLITQITMIHHKMTAVQYIHNFNNRTAGNDTYRIRV